MPSAQMLVFFIFTTCMLALKYTHIIDISLKDDSEFCAGSGTIQGKISQSLKFRKEVLAHFIQETKKPRFIKKSSRYIY